MVHAKKLENLLEIRIKVHYPLSNCPLTRGFKRTGRGASRGKAAIARGGIAEAAIVCPTDEPARLSSRDVISRDQRGTAK